MTLAELHDWQIPSALRELAEMIEDDAIELGEAAIVASALADLIEAEANRRTRLAAGIDAEAGCVKCGASGIPIVGHEPCPGMVA